MEMQAKNTQNFDRQQPRRRWYEVQLPEDATLGDAEAMRARISGGMAFVPFWRLAWFFLVD